MIRKGGCQLCYWSDQCSQSTTCDNFTPIDSNDDDIAEYNRIIAENTQEYDEYVRDFDL